MDVRVERDVQAPPAAVARVMFDPDQDPRWIGGAKLVERLTPGPLGPGSRVRRHGGFLGRKFSWITEIAALEPDRHLRMTIVTGPLRGDVAYDISPSGAGSRVSLHNRGQSRFAMPLMSWFVRRSLTADLARLAALIERPPGVTRRPGPAAPPSPSAPV